MRGTARATLEAAARIDEVYDLLADLYEFFIGIGRSPLYVYGLTGEDERRIDDSGYSVSLDADAIEGDELPGIYWCQIIPPAIVDTVGEEQLLSAPGHRVERLSDGAVMLVLHRYPVSDTDEVTVADHLGVPYETPH